MTPSPAVQLQASLDLIACHKEQAANLIPASTAPPPDSEIPSRLSPSSVNCYMDCSARWYYRKVLELPETRSAALSLGTAVHAGVIQNFRQKIESGRDMSIRDTQAVFIHSLCDEIDLGIRFQTGESADDLKEAGEVMTKVYMEHSAPFVSPAAVEEHVEGEIGGVPVHVYIDIRTTDGRVIDIKTAKKKPTGISAAHRLQVSTYVMLHPEASGEATISTLTKTRMVALQQDSVSILAADRKLTERLYSITRDQMHGLVSPNRASFLCGKHCDFRGRCLDDYGGVMNVDVEA
jgi:CRISPR/Cas system-associated exonuclease Cas4 (RecB family)